MAKMHESGEAVPFAAALRSAWRDEPAPLSSVVDSINKRRGRYALFEHFDAAAGNGSGSQCVQKVLAYS